jgi:sec-independent protein translocase protein TatA
MFGLTIWHWLIVAVVVVALFGTGVLAPVLRNIGRGLGAFRQGVAEGQQPPKDGT